MANQPNSTFLKEKRIIVYNDAKNFGGHEVMTLRAIRLLLSKCASVSCFYCPLNQKWESALRGLETESPNLTLHEVELPKIRFHQPYHFFHPKLVRDMAESFKQLSPDLVFVAQGTLETSAVGALATLKAGLPCLSYIPLAHSFRELGSNRAFRRDLFNSYLAKTPTRWLTNGKAQVNRLKERGANQPIDFLPNLVEIANPLPAGEAKQRLGFAQSDLVIGMCGRMDKQQKGCDIFIDAVRRAPKDSLLRQARLLFIGDGPYWVKMKEDLNNDGWVDSIKHVGWTDKPENYYSAFSLMVIPSRFEGLPVAMQEAILCDAPVAATAVDGMADFLPANWTCKPKDPSALLRLIESYIENPKGYRAPLEKLKATIRTEYNHEAFEEALISSIDNTLRS
ncbi:glycosyltransferase family 4 protein [Rubellicoccus peritrichatus]|uniref:Glycosyltransferase family 4 protein n=1 Tax=Rubellicoccus peritrichatus TaxID=3080537 RepID=A0AAQ3L9E2_9BACT|nr:glycosyltransferase family 4 protein [Puniceicoccus sp. CR14]WOO42044.1 glycosyltransferase family 4 protein [Puniceicoccus sp. CR14]